MGEVLNTEVIGNLRNRKEFEKIVQSGNVLHSYLFLGQAGIGKRLIAKDFAKNILCLNHESDCKCKSCICFESNSHPDFKILNEEGENITISQVRELIQTVYEKPILSEKKVYIINDSDKMNTESQNCILKTLEEPPEYLCFILIASNQDMLLNTIKSRCTKIVFEKLTTNEISQILAQKQLLSNDLSEKMFNLFDGSAGKAIKILEKKENYETIDEFIDTIKTTGKLDFITKSKSIFDKENIYEILEYCLVSFFYNGKKQADIHFLNCAQYVQQTINSLKRNANFDMSIDNMLFQIWEEVNENNSWG